MYFFKIKFDSYSNYLKKNYCRKKNAEINVTALNEFSCIKVFVGQNINILSFNDSKSLIFQRSYPVPFAKAHFVVFRKSGVTTRCLQT